MAASAPSGLDGALEGVVEQAGGIGTRHQSPQDPVQLLGLGLTHGPVIGTSGPDPERGLLLKPGSGPADQMEDIGEKPEGGWS
jgi:hypothetical protein